MRIAVGEIERRLSKLMKEEPRKVEEYIINTRPMLILRYAKKARCDKDSCS
jgi:hypothetical protein